MGEQLMKKYIVYVVCDAGMGSSALGASYLRKALKDSDLHVEVSNRSMEERMDDADLLISHHHFEAQLKHRYPDKKVIGLIDFVNKERFREVVRTMENLENKVLLKENIKVNCEQCSSDEAILRVGQDLLKSGYIEEKYIEGMLARDHSLSVYMGNQIALPHGEYEYKKNILKSGIVIHVYPQPIDWHGEAVSLVIGLAGIGEEHMMILSNIATVFGEMEAVEKVLKNQNMDDIYDLLTQSEEV
jgi:mannitol/fructose-specific phosphotransferase system IIA component/galactitol-specific phosphotransferase system IIB component